jgi:hypothetical protein
MLPRRAAPAVLLFASLVLVLMVSIRISHRPRISAHRYEPTAAPPPRHAPHDEINALVNRSGVAQKTDQEKGKKGQKVPKPKDLSWEEERDLLVLQRRTSCGRLVSRDVARVNGFPGAKDGAPLHSAPETRLVVGQPPRPDCAYTENNDTRILLCDDFPPELVRRAEEVLRQGPPLPKKKTRKKAQRRDCPRVHLMLDTTSVDFVLSHGVAMFPEEPDFVAPRMTWRADSDAAYATVHREGDVLRMYARQEMGLRSRTHVYEMPVSATLDRSPEGRFVEQTRYHFRDVPGAVIGNRTEDGASAEVFTMFRDPRWKQGSGEPGPYFGFGNFHSVLFASPDGLNWTNTKIALDFPSADSANHISFDTYWARYRLTRRDNLGCGRRSAGFFECGLATLWQCFQPTPGNQGPLRGWSPMIPGRFPWFRNSIVGFYEELYGSFTFQHPTDPSILLNWAMARRNVRWDCVSADILFFSSYDGGRQWHRVGGDDTRAYLAKEQTEPYDPDYFESCYAMMNVNGVVTGSGSNMSLFTLGATESGAPRNWKTNMFEWGLDAKRLASLRCSFKASCVGVTYPLRVCGRSLVVRAAGGIDGVDVVTADGETVLEEFQTGDEEEDMAHKFALSSAYAVIRVRVYMQQGARLFSVEFE